MLTYQEPVLEQLLQVDYILGSELTCNPYYIGLICNQLTCSLKDYFPELCEEIVASFNDFILAKDSLLNVLHHIHGELIIRVEWVSYPAHRTLMQIVCQIINHTFVRFPKCDHRVLSYFVETITPITLFITGHDPDYCELNINFTTDIAKSAFIINLFPDIFKPYVDSHLSIDIIQNLLILPGHQPGWPTLLLHS